MGRRKIEIKAIKDDRNRSVTFLKRKGGLFKKAHELAVLCSVDVAVIIFGSNKKLYEFSSCDMHETLNRYQYYGPPHEHKGPEDFSGKRDDDDDDDEDTPAPDDMHPTPPQNPPPMLPPHMQHHPGFQHVHHAPSASPPLPNGMPVIPRHGTPQPQVVSRPSSRNNLRRVSGHLAPGHHQATPPPPQNGFTYMPNPSVYHPGAPPRPGHYAQFAHHGPMPPHTMAHHHPPPQSVAPPQPHHHAMAQHAPALTLSQAPPHPAVAPAYLPDQRNSMPPTFPAEPPPSHPSRTVSMPDGPATDHPPRAPPVKTEGSQSPQPPPHPSHQSHPPHPPRSLSSKSRSIFTPIDDRGSVLARHFGLGPPSPRPDTTDGAGEASREASPAVGTAATTQSAPPPPRRAATDTPRGRRPPSSSHRPGPTAAGQCHRRRLLVRRPQGPHPGQGQQPGRLLVRRRPPAAVPLRRRPPERRGPGAAESVRPAPPPGAAAAQNAAAYGANNNIETPISALPSRFVSDALLPSPSSFFPEWGFGRSGPDSNMLPSPLTFPTPSGPTGPGFSRDDEPDKKRKSPEGGGSGEGASKKTKT
ncbi:hypothetical protein P168DRAFT_314162 [Aspergillus campestris IBT 28561]|uniref:MADS-box domain-containing protein n=1 Tax=Aspergillus campestris (strain IBT 28561) TaxID=1392248 RepID=A0A2I1DDU2_ASPC2|nr:uncharacterized protein P168DRAFT_314162 [Aspergillus campestris IBT 28561]PKY08034.1 hypothetical protein P168DRAFT_314162 [Aspergillus campestris IBT 28561]